MFTNVSDELKEIVKSDTITAVAKVYFPSLDLWIYPKAEEGVESSLVDVIITDNCYDSGKLLGTTMAKEVELRIINKDSLDLADEEFELYVGVKLLNGEYEYVPYGNFIVSIYEDTKSNNIFKLIAYDYMTKLNENFKKYVKTSDTNIIQGKKYYKINEDENFYTYVLVQNPVIEDIDMYYEEKFVVVYPISLKNFKEQLLTSLEIEYEEQDLANDNFMINNEVDFSGYTNRNIISIIAELQGCFVKFNRNNKLQFYPLNLSNSSYYENETLTLIDNTVNVTNETLNCDENYSTEINENNDYNLVISGIQEIETIDAKSMNSRLIINKQYGPVNVVSLTMKDITGENVTLRDEDSITQNGETTIEIQDNPFLYTQALRENAIEELFNTLNGFSYSPTEFQYKARLYLDGGDAIAVYNVENNEYVNSIVLNQTIKVPTTRQSSMKNNALTKTQVLKQYVSKNEQQNKHTEIIVDKHEQRIQSIVEEIGDRSQKTTSITQDIDGIQSAVEDIEDLTNTVSGLKTVSITDAYPNENILELHIYGNNSVFDYLYPADDLYPDDSLLPYGDSKIRFYNSKEDRIINLGINEVLRQNEEVRDEVVIDYEGKVSLIRRVNKNGTTKPMPEVTQLGTLHFTLVEGTNTFEIVNYTAPIEVKYAMKSTLTDIFATRAEMNSEIQQTAESIDVNVNKKLRDYTTHQETEEAVQELNTTIEITAEGINTEVSKKVGNDEVISKINQSAEAVGINANKINLSANDVINLLAGNEINLSSKNITIKADDLLINNQGMSFTYQGNSVGSFQTTQIVDDPSKRGLLMVIDNNAHFLGLGKEDANHYTNQIFAFYNSPTSSHDNAIQIGNPNWNTFVTLHNDLYVYGYVNGANIINRSLEEIKKDISKCNINAINEVKNTDIYNYRLKEEKENSKKHFGIVIGDKYKYSKAIVNEDNNGVELYSMLSILWKAVQEQQEQIEQLQKEIKEMKGE